MRSWFDWLEKTEPRGHMLYDILANVLDPGDWILDLACGMAPLAKYLKDYKYVGVDIGEEFCKRLSGYDIKVLDVLSSEGMYLIEGMHPEVLLLLGLGNHPYNQPGFISLLERVNPRIVLVEYAYTENESMPRIQALKKISHNLYTRNYGLIGTGKFDAELEQASKRVWLLLGKDYLPVGYYEGRFQDPMFCRDSKYRLRDEALIALLDEPPRKVFEFAGASGLLAEVMLGVYPSIQFYHHTDVSPLACKMAFRAMTKALAESDTASTVYSEPMNIIWKRPDLTKYDLVTTTSMEHIPKGTDLRIIESLAPGTVVLFSLTYFGKVGHPHPFLTRDYITSRYGGLIDVEKLMRYDPLQVWLMKGIKR